MSKIQLGGLTLSQFFIILYVARASTRILGVLPLTRILLL